MIFSDRRKDTLLDPALKIILIDIIITRRSVFSSILRFSTPWKRRRRGGGGRGWVCILVSLFFKCNQHQSSPNNIRTYINKPKLKGKCFSLSRNSLKSFERN